MAAKKNGGMVIPRSAMPPSRVYPDSWGSLWREVKGLPPNSGYQVRLSDYRATMNALRCAVQRAKRKGRLPEDMKVRGPENGTIAYLYRD